MVQSHQPRLPENVPLAISISLSEVYGALCPACREVLLDYISGKAGAGMLRESLRKQFEAVLSPSPTGEPQDPPQP